MEKIKAEIKEKSMRQKLRDKEITWKEYEQYRVPLRDKGKEKTMRQKREDGEITWIEYENYRLSLKSDNKKSMREKYRCGQISNKEYRDFIAQLNGFKNKKEYEDYKAQQKGFKDKKALDESLVQMRGFKDLREYKNHLNHISGKNHSQFDDKSCTNYLGVVIAEQYLSKIFESVQRMPQNFPGYDFICGRGYKIDVKSSCFRDKRKFWRFEIKENKNCDYFLLLAVDTRTGLNPEHIWLIRGTELVGVNGEQVQLNTKANLEICKSDRSLQFYKQFEQTDKLEKLIACCNKVKQK